MNLDNVRGSLRVCVGAANRLPDDETLSAFADRFLLRLFVDAIGDPRLEELLAAGRLLERDEAPPRASLEDLDVLIATARDMELRGVRDTLADAIRLLRGAGIELSDRRCVKVQNLIAAASAIDGRTEASGADLWPLIYAVPTAQEQDLAREVLRDLLGAASSAALAAAATEASAGPLARAASIARSGEALFAERDEDADPTHWRLRLEGLAREIDAGFATDDLPPDLEALRLRIVNALSDREPRRGERSPLNGDE